MIKRVVCIDINMGSYKTIFYKLAECVCAANGDEWFYCTRHGASPVSFTTIWTAALNSILPDMWFLWILAGCHQVHVFYSKFVFLIEVYLTTP
jgi:hypothetical protein